MRILLTILLLLPALAKADMLEKPLSPIANNIKIGLLLPVKNESLQDVVMPLVNSAVLAVYNYDSDPIKKDTNLRGLYDSRYSQIVKLYDTTESVTGAVQKAIDDGVNVLVGTLSAANSLKVNDYITTKNGTRVPFISFSNNDALASKGILTIGYRPTKQLKDSIKEAVESGITNFSIVSFHQGLYDLSLKAYRDVYNDYKWFSKNPWQSKIQLLNKIKLDQPTTGAKDKIVQILREHKKLNNKTAIIFPDGAKNLKFFSDILSQGDLADIQVIGSGLWFDAKTLGQTSLEKSQISAPSVMSVEKYQLEYHKNYGSIPYIASSIAYDAVALVLTMSEELGRKELIFTDFISSKGFNGVTGKFRFGLNGLIERNYPKLTLNNGKFTSK